MRILVLSLVACIAFAGTARGEAESDPGEIEDRAARVALERHGSTVEQARQVYLRALMDADQALIRDLDGAVTRVTRAGNLEDALRIRAARQEAQSQLAERETELPVQRRPDPEELIGQWSIKWSNGVSHVYEIYPDGTARTMRDRQNLGPARVHMIEGVYVLHVEEYGQIALTPRGAHLILELYYLNRGGLGARMPDHVGVGVRN